MCDRHEILIVTIRKIIREYVFRQRCSAAQTAKIIDINLHIYTFLFSLLSVESNCEKLQDNRKQKVKVFGDCCLEVGTVTTLFVLFYRA